MVNNRLLFAVIAILISSTLLGQNYLYGYLVEFTDKANTTYTINNPNEYLSQKAIDRRVRNNIDITEQDFPVNRNYIDSISNDSVKLHVTSRWLNSAVFYSNNSEFVDDITSISFVSSVTLVYKGNVVLKSVNRNKKWLDSNSDDKYGTSYNQIAMCNAQTLHNGGYKGQGVHIAVLDAGFWRVNEMACFDSLFMNNRILGHWDFVSHNGNVFDDNSHGMGVLSIIAGNLPDELVGTAPEASYYLFRTEDVNSEYPIEEENWIAAAEVADSAGVDIITSSLGYNTYDDIDMSHTYASMDGKSTRITRGAEIAFSKGIFIVNSAGNEGRNDWHYITAPSDGEHILCVGAVDENEHIAPFSSNGPSFDGRIKPDVVAKGLATTIIKTNETVGVGNGTSYSCPVIAGMVACLWQALPTYTNQELLKLIHSYSDRFNTPSNRYGYGIPDFGKATFVIDSSEFNPNSKNQLTKVYPNPFVDKISFHIYINTSQTIYITIYNASGVKIHSQTQEVSDESYNLITINDLAALSNGYYTLSIITNNGILNEKIVK